jgi:hypothetical protein
MHAVQDPARLGWEPVRVVEHYRVGAREIEIMQADTPE